MNISEAEEQFKPCKKCGSEIKAFNMGNYWFRATCSNTECWLVSRKYRSLEELVKAVNRRR
jgi:hypothetical protein